MKFSNQSKTSLLSFIITFFVCLLIFALLGWLIYGTISKQFTSDGDKDSEISEEIPANSEVESAGSQDEQKNPDDIIEGENFNILVAGYNITGEFMDAMTVVEVNKDTKAVTVYPINTDTKVYVGYGSAGSVNIRLGDLCKYKNMEYIAKKVTALTAVKIDYYISFTAEAFIDAIDALNKNKVYSYTVPKDMNLVYSNDPELEKYNIEFKRADKITSGIDIYNVLRYEGDSSSDRMDRQTTITRDVVKAFVDSQIKSKEPSKVISTLNSLLKTLKGCTTNISLDTFITEGYELISSISEFKFTSSTIFKTTSINFK